jgi:tetratricopeptide (TPR) repeat protein
MNFRPALVLAAALLVAGCRQRAITPLERDEAANDMSEANFALTLKDWGRAEGLYAKATELCPDEGDAWVSLGVVRMRMHNPGGARSAYKSALAAYKDNLKTEPVNPAFAIREAYVLVLLGRADEAKSCVERARSKYPDDRRIRSFADSNGLEKMLADPALKDLTP